MSQNPSENRDPNIDLTRDDPASSTSPVGTGAQQHVRLDSDDLPPERIERLGQFLSDSTLGNVTDDVKHPGKNFFPIDGGNQRVATPTVGEGDSTQVKYTDLIDAAKREFDELKNASAFDGENLPPLSDRAKGHYFLEGGPASNAIGGLNTEGAHTYVEKQLDDPVQNSRWAHIGKRTISETTQGNNPFFSRPVGVPSSLPGELQGKNTDGNSQSAHSSFQTYSHGGSIEANADRNVSTFWDDYFARMSRVGAALTIKATGRDTSTYANGNTEQEANRILSNVGKTAIDAMGDIEEGDLSGHWARKDLEDMYASNAFQDGDTTNILDKGEMNKRFGKQIKSHGSESNGSVNTKSWGQSYSWDDPFVQEGLPGAGSKALTAVAEMAQVYLFCAVRAALVGLLFGAARVIEGGKKEFVWANPDDPQNVKGTELKKGSSRYNSIIRDGLIEKHQERRAERAAEMGVSNKLAISGRVAVQGLVDQTLRTVNDEVINLPRALLREVSLYIPRNYLTQLENTFEPDESGVGVLKLVGHSLFISTAYLLATVGGLTEFAGNLLLQDFGKSLGFWRSIFKEVTRSRAEFVTRREKEGWYSGFLKFLGKDDKCTGFMNYLAMLGDMTVASGVSGPINFPIMDVPLDHVPDFPTLRPSKYRDSNGRSTTGVTSTPSMFLLPGWVSDSFSSENDLVSHVSGRQPGTFGAALRGKENRSAYAKFTAEEQELIQKRFQTPKSNNRFTTRQVQLMEDQLEAEYMPFYLQDLRTNEIISFHAFLTSLSDSYTGDWASQKGFGRLEAVQTYGGASRSIGVAFTMVATSKEDFDELWWKANKLVTMVYPQWSKGTTLQNGNNKFVQPFSQVMTASPLARLRVGDLFTSNYSKENMARMMGADDMENFAWDEFEPSEGRNDAGTYIHNKDLIAFLRKRKKRKEANDLTVQLKNGQLYSRVYLSPVEPYDEEGDFRSQVKFTINYERPVIELLGGPVYSVPSNAYVVDIPPEAFLLRNAGLRVLELPNGSGPTGDLEITQYSQLNFPTIFTNSNPIIKSFESNMGRGIAVAINSITFDYKMGSFPWELEPGNRAPRWIDVQLGVVPIHDITPGLDHRGFNRAPVYKVGDYAKSISGDSHYDNGTYNAVLQNIKDGHRNALKGKEYDREAPDEGDESE